MTELPWQRFEREAMRRLGGQRFTGQLLTHAKQPDGEISDFDLVCDTKLRASWKHHSMLRDLAGKYCKGGRTPCLITRETGRPGALVVLPLDAVAEILNEVRRLRENEANGPKSEQPGGAVSHRAER